MSSGGFKTERCTHKSRKPVKKKRSQSSLTSFFTSANVKKQSKIVTTDLIDGGVKLECPYCFKFFSTQGFANHVRKHEVRGDKITSRPRVGKVKLRGPKYPEPVQLGVSTVDLTTKETHTEPVDLTTTVDPNPDTVVVDSTPPKVGGVTRRNFGDFRLTPGGNSYVDGVVEGFQVNLVQLSGGLSVSKLMANNDINVTSVCILVCLVNGEVQISWTIPGVFWHFVPKERILRPLNMATPARTLMRIAYKSFKLGIPSDCEGLDPTDGLLFKSHHKKFEEMGVWASCQASPLQNFKLKTVKENKEWKFTNERQG